MEKPKFYQPSCWNCPALHAAKTSYENSYCTGFPGKRQKRFPKGGPKKTVPDWCPKRISPPVCRIYGFASDEDAYMEFMLNYDSAMVLSGSAYPQERRYKLRCTYPLKMTAKEFYETSQISSVFSVFPDQEFEFGEIVEIDDGLKPYYFYYAAGHGFIMAPIFDKTKIGKAVL